MSMLDLVRAAKASGDFAPVVAAIPYARFLGFEVLPRDGALLGVMRYSDHLIGNISLPALHGGTVGALLESTAIFQVLYQAETVILPKTITITVEYLRPGRPVDTFARAIVTRQGRRVVNVRSEAFQEDPARPIATATALFLVMAETPPDDPKR